MNLSLVEFEFVQAMVRARCGLVLDADKAYYVETRLKRVIERFGFDSFATLMRHIRSNDVVGLERAMIEAVLNGETAFFRDAALFDAIRREILPRLIEARTPQRTLSIWSAAASTGQEAYSLAMLLADDFPQLADWNVRITGTDYSQEHLARARTGRYRSFEVNRGLPAATLLHHFEQDADGWVLHDDVRTRVEFREANLLTQWWPPDEFDLVLLRNVMIYWDRETKHRVLERVRTALRPEGWLVLGASETTMFVHEGFEPLALCGASVFRKVSGDQSGVAPLRA